MIKGKEFLSLPVERVVHIIQSDKLMVANEEEVSFRSENNKLESPFYKSSPTRMFCAGVRGETFQMWRMTGVGTDRIAYSYLKM